MAVDTYFQLFLQRETDSGNSFYNLVPFDKYPYRQVFLLLSFFSFLFKTGTTLCMILKAH